MASPEPSLGRVVLDETRLAMRRQKDLAEGALAQASDEDFFRLIDAESNSLAVIVKHVGGNLRSRWTDFLVSDGEKPDRDRDDEFVAADSAGRSAIMQIWERGWRALFDTLDQLTPADLIVTVHIRGEAVNVVAAIQRSLAHTAQHVGQIVFLAKHLRSTEWRTLSIPRGQSAGWSPARQVRPESTPADSRPS